MIELNWLDLRFRARGPIAPTPAVVIAAIDERSLEAEGRWPWPRSRIAALVQALSEDGAKVVGFDVTFTEQDAGHDAILAAALKASSAAVVLGYFFHMRQADLGYPLAPEDIERRIAALETSRYPLVRQAGGEPASWISAYAPQNNLDLLTSAAASSGYFNVPSDLDGDVRWVPLAIQSGEDLFPPLALLCAWHYLGKPHLAIRAGRYGVEGAEIAERFVPTDEDGRLLLNYRGPPATFPHYSASDIVARRLPPGTFRDKIVLVGATAIGIGDLRSAPFAPVYPGVEIHATAIDNILAGDFLARPRWSKVLDVAAIIALSAVVGLTLPRASALAGFLIAAGALLFYVVLAGALFLKARVWLNMVYPVLALAGTYTILTVFRYVSEEQERKRIKLAFQRYVAPDVIEIMMKDPGGVRLGGHEAVLTALISDLEGFTTFSERHSPSDIIGVLGDYYAEMTEQIYAQQGTLVEYVGDEVFALFGAPVPQPDHAKRACDTALAMRARRAALGDEWVKIGRPRIKARTGINTGTMLIGNIGSKYRFHYGAIGDPVNLTSRLEGLNKTYGTDIILSDYTARLVPGMFRLRELDLVRVKGRQESLRVHELLGAADAPLADEQLEMLQVYALALAAYRERRWDHALDLFRQCRVLWPEDGPSRTFERRCLAFRADPPPEDWGGMFEQLTK